MPELSVGTLIVLGWVCVVGLVVVTTAALMSGRKSLRILAVALIWLAVWLREFGAEAALRDAVALHQKTTIDVTQFREGAMAMTSYLDRSAVGVFIPALMLGVLALWWRKPSVRRHAAPAIPPAPPADY